VFATNCPEGHSEKVVELIEYLLGTAKEQFSGNATKFLFFSKKQ